MSQNPTSTKLEKSTLPPIPWAEVSLDKWNDWKWQMANRLNTVEDFSQFIDLTENEIKGLSAQGIFLGKYEPVRHNRGT